MAKAKKQSIEDAINIFEDVMDRSSLTDYLFMNRILISKNPKEHTILIPVDQCLWNALIENPKFKSHIQELDVIDDENNDIIKNCSYCNDLNSDSWVDLDCNELYAGNLLKINIEGLEYDININKALIPLKLKKAEFTDIKYRIFIDDMTLALKKRFNYPIEDCGFSIIRLFQIV